jgi:O-antigen/teichoic acid export membrane protein
MNAVTQLAFVPILLKWWGGQLYGEWQIMTAAVVYITFLNFGMHTYVGNRLNQCYSRGEMNECTRVLHSALLVAVLILVVAFFIFVPMFWLLPLTKWLQLKVTTPAAAAFVCTVLLFKILFSVPAGFIGGVYWAVGDYARERFAAQTLQPFAIAAATVIVVMLGGGVVQVACVHLIGFFTLILFLWRDSQRRHSEIRLGLRHADLRLGLHFVAPSILFFVLELSYALAIQGSTLLIGIGLGAIPVAVFVTLRTLAHLIFQLVAAVSSSLRPELTSLEAQGRYAELREIHTISAKILLWLSVTVALFVHFAGKDVVRLWTGGRIIYEPALMDVLLLMQVSAAWYESSLVVLTASNKHQSLAWMRTVSSAAGLLAGYLFLHRIGVTGVALGLLTADVFTCAWFVPRSACRMLGRSTLKFAASVLGIGTAVSAALFTATYLIHAYAGSLGPVWRTAVTAVWLSLAGPASCVFLWLSASERGRVLSLIRNRRSVRSIDSNGYVAETCV